MSRSDALAWLGATVYVLISAAYLHPLSATDCTAMLVEAPTYADKQAMREYFMACDDSQTDFRPCSTVCSTIASKSA